MQNFRLLWVSCFLNKGDIMAYIKNLDIFLMPISVQEFGKLAFEVFM